MAPRPYQRHGLTTLKRHLKVRGLDGIDRRSAPARALLAWRRELVADLGGAEAFSAQQRAVIEVASTTKLPLDSVYRESDVTFAASRARAVPGGSPQRLFDKLYHGGAR